MRHQARRGSPARLRVSEAHGAISPRTDCSRPNALVNAIESARIQILPDPASMNPAIYEKSGIFFLGGHLEGQELGDAPFLYDSRDLCTHAVCVGMTGSGKTGLGAVILEEAAIDGIPAIVIDPKGDMGNLALGFPELRPADFREWVDPDEARRKNLSPDALADEKATLWKKGLASWGQDGERIATLHRTAQVDIFTPGSASGRPIALLQSLRAPGRELMEDPDLLRERVGTTVSSILSLVDIDADPLISPEHILLSTLLAREWEAGRDLDLLQLIAMIPRPPIERLGAFDLESFYPAKERFELATRLNGLVASPGFAAWMEGEALDIDRLLFTPEGKPRVAVLNIASLTDKERMFFVTLLLGEMIAWMRRQPGTSSLRALLYMDELFGFLPPIGNPPSKTLFLTLLKQARAFGLGLVLCSQNPVDIDYKALSNAGTWFIGRLQTERDRDRLLDGLSDSFAGGEGALNIKQLHELIPSLGKRRFVAHNVHEGAPQVFETRWALSYLAGPLSRTQLRKLVRPAPASHDDGLETAGSASSGETPADVRAAADSPAPQDGASVAPPVIAPEIPLHFLPINVEKPAGAELLYRPMVLAHGDFHIDRKRPPIVTSGSFQRIAAVDDSPVPLDWRTSHEIALSLDQLEKTTTAEVSQWIEPASAMLRPSSYRDWERDLVVWAAENIGATLYKVPSTGMTSEPGESREAFQQRVAIAARERRDVERDELAERYGARLQRLEEKLGEAEYRAQQRLADVQAHERAQWADLAGMFLGRRRSAGAMIRGGRAQEKRRSRAAAAQDKIVRAEDDIMELRDELQRELATLEAKYQQEIVDIESQLITPPRSNVNIRFIGLVWVPYWFDARGRKRAWRP